MESPVSLVQQGSIGRQNSLGGQQSGLIRTQSLNTGDPLNRQTSLVRQQSLGAEAHYGSPRLQAYIKHAQDFQQMDATQQESFTNVAGSENSPQVQQGLSGVLQANGAPQGLGLEVPRSNVGEQSMRELEDLLTKLNPLAKEFTPSTQQAPSTSSSSSSGAQMRSGGQKKRNGGGARKRSSRATKAQREDSVKRTVYVSDIDQQVTEEQLAALFTTCGQVVDCRICGDPNSVLRFAFVEFTDEDGARAALSLAGTVLGFYPVRVLPSKTAIVPVNPTFLPRSEDERELCARTVYCANIDKKVTQADVKLFFESLCGEVNRLRLLGDYHHSTRIAFVEFIHAESAMAALNCSGAILGSLPIRVSPSKTPVRPRSPRPPSVQRS